MRTKDKRLIDCVKFWGRPETAKRMGVTRQRVQQMVTTEAREDVYLRVGDDGTVVGWYIYKQVG